VKELRIFGVHGIGEVRAGDDLGALIVQALAPADGAQPEHLLEGDVLVVSSKVISKAEGRTVAADTREAQVEAETVRLVAARRTPRGLAQIVEAAAGPVMAAAGVDASNVAAGTVLLLPKDPDASARSLRARLRELTGARIGVILSDTAGRAWRDGQVDFALGAAGLAITDDLRGAADTHGQPLEVTVRALADELAAAADLIKGKLTEIPVAVIRGAEAQVSDDDGPGAAILLRPAHDDWFRYGHVEAVRASLGVDPADADPPTVPAAPPEQRFRRALSLALQAPTPFAAEPAECGPGGGVTAENQPLVPHSATERFGVEVEGGTARVVLRGRGGEVGEELAVLGALAQRIQAAAWSEDLALQLVFAEGPPASIRITSRTK
jgi:coenzyme F420-0:L-glutamate ligase/coenzyme F420-1:gamma-L-glutamate ligase